MRPSGWVTHSGCLLALAAACATGRAADPSRPAAPAAATARHRSAPWPSAYFPLGRDMRWVYRERVGWFHRRRVVWTARELRPVHGSDTPLFVVRERGEGSFFGIEDSGLLGFAVEGGFVIRFSAIGEDSRGELRIFGEEGLRVLPVQPADGQRWEQDWHLFSTPESQGAPRHWNARVERLASLRVPAGRFHDVVRVEMEYRDPSLSQDRAQLSFEDYYAAGVGLVKSVSHDHEGGPWRTITRELESFEDPQR